MKHCCFFIFLFSSFLAQSQQFSHSDSLRGTITPQRDWWDLTFYHLDVEVLPDLKQIHGTNTIRYRVVRQHNVMQIDLQPPLKIKKVVQDGTELAFTSTENAHFVQLQQPQPPGSIQSLTVHYGGHPRPAIRAPWDGGISWTKDANGQPFIASSCQGLGASIWWPCKDHMADEVDSMLISIEVPETLVDVSNGRLRNVEHNSDKKTKTFHWFVANPINNYGVNINIGNYTSWKEKYNGEKGPLDITYWALKQDEAAAKKQFQEVPRMLKAFEHWFGPYPFYEDGFQLVQAPYLGMEHQSSITYGNRFMNGYLGQDLSGTGWGLTFDFIIVHESGHEWFANNITHTDLADMWIHESFTNYSESLFVEYHHGKEAGQEYVRGTRMHIENKVPMIGPYGVNFDHYPIDVYYKGGNVLNTLRTWVDDDDTWRRMLRSLNQQFYHQTVKSVQVEAQMAEVLSIDLTAFFDQYLRDARIPIFEYYFKEGNLHFRWTNAISGFDMPVDVTISGQALRLEPRTSWKHLPLAENDLSVNLNYYIGVLKSR